MFQERCRCVLCFAILCLLVGCSQEPPTGLITGQVTVDGQPLQDGRIQFTPLDGQSQPGGASVVEGKFTAKVPVAKMKVEINGNKRTGRKIKAYDTPESPLMDEIVELVPPKYNINSDLTLDVKPGPQDVKYDLKSSK